MRDTTNPQDLIGKTVVGAGGDSIGSVSTVLLDEATGQPEFVAVRTGLFGMRESVVPLAQATLRDGSVAVPYDEQTVKGSPRLEPDQRLTQDEERELYDYFGLPYSHEPSATGLPGAGTDGEDSNPWHDGGRTVGHDTSGPTTDEAMTRSEEQLRVGTQQVETGRARLRKYVVTEQVHQTVPVTHEEVRVEREPITEGNVGRAMDGPAISEEEHEVTLHAERPVVAKEAVPVERVRLATDQVSDEARIEETVRKEQIETPDA